MAPHLLATEHAGNVLRGHAPARATGTPLLPVEILRIAAGVGEPLPVLAEAIVLPALLRIRQDRVGLVDGLESTLCLGVPLVGIRMVGARQLAKGALDGFLVGVAANAQRLVVVRYLHPISRWSDTALFH